MRQHVIPAAIAALVSAGVGYGAAVSYKPKPIVIEPKTTVVSRADAAANPGKSDARKIAAAWGDLDQKEIDALTAELKVLPKTDVIIFCDGDPCADLALDLENAFESAKWTVKVERPFYDDTIGIATSRVNLGQAIERATSGRLTVKQAPNPTGVSLPSNSGKVVDGVVTFGTQRQPDIIAIGKKPK